MYYSHDRKLHRAGWITGVAGAAIIFISMMLVGGEPSGKIQAHIIPAALMYSLPFLALTGIASLWPKGGGIVMIAISGCFALGELVFYFAANLPPAVFILIAIVSGPSMASGILFYLSKKRVEARYG